MRIPALRIHKADGSAQEPLMEAEGNIQDVFADFLDVSKAVRASIDWAMRLEKEGNSKDLDLFEQVRCLNC